MKNEKQIKSKSENLKIKNLSWKPDKKEILFVLENINALFEKGKFYGILGPNGSGKTSLIKHILKFLDIKDSGSIILDEKNLNEYSRKELACRISYVPQNVNLDVSFNAYEMIAMGRNPYLKRFEETSREDKEKIEYAIDITNSRKLLEKKFSLLSGGEAQRILAARAIAQDTDYIILDEPVSHLDIFYQVDIMNTFKKLNKEKEKTIIAILHDLNLAYIFCTDIFLMKNGKIFKSGKTSEVLIKENLQEIYNLKFEIYKSSENKKIFFPILNR